MKKFRWLVCLTLILGAMPSVARAEEAGGGPLDVNGGLVIWTLVIFALLFAVLRRFVWPVILGAVEDREKRLEQLLADAERNKAESAALLAQQTKQLADTRNQVQSMLADATTAADKARADAIAKTRLDQEEMIARARRDIAGEKDKALIELRREAVDLSLAAATKLMGARLDSDADRKLVSDYLATLERN
jgi:F-type H+-transporting ATPase subunit b